MTTKDWEAQSLHRHLNYQIHAKVDELLHLARGVTCDVGGDPALETAVEHLRLLLVTANARRLIRESPRVAWQQLYHNHDLSAPRRHDYLTPGELETLAAAAENTRDAG